MMPKGFAGGSAEGPGDALPEPLGVAASDGSARRRNTGDAAADDIVGEVAPVAAFAAKSTRTRSAPAVRRHESVARSAASARLTSPSHARSHHTASTAEMLAALSPAPSSVSVGGAAPPQPRAAGAAAPR